MSRKNIEADGVSIEKYIEFQQEWIDEEGFLSNVNYREVLNSPFFGTRTFKDLFKDAGPRSHLRLVGLSPMDRNYAMGRYNQPDGETTLLRFRINIPVRTPNIGTVIQWLSDRRIAQVDASTLTVRDQHNRIVRQALRVKDAGGDARWFTTGEQMWVRHHLPEDFLPLHQTEWYHLAQRLMDRRYQELGGDLKEFESPGRAWLDAQAMDFKGVETTPLQGRFLAVLYHLLDSTREMEPLKRWARLADATMVGWDGKYIAPLPEVTAEMAASTIVRLCLDLKEAPASRSNEAPKADLRGMYD